MEIKVLHILRTYLPVTENWLFNLLTNCSGCDHIIYAEKILPGVFEDDRFEFYSLPEYLQEREGNSFSDKLIRRIKSLSNFFSGNSRIKFVEQLILYEKPDIIHFHFGTMALTYNRLFRELKIPSIVSFYGYDYNIKYDYHNIFMKSYRMICEGFAGKETLIHLGCLRDKISIIKLGIPVKQRALPKNKLSNHLKLIQVASFTEKKGHIYTILAFQKAKKLYPGISLTFIVPDIKGKSDITAYVKQLRLEKDIIIKQAVSPEGLYEVLRNYDVFIHPSVLSNSGDHEGGAPVVLLDAQSQGLPIISTRHKDIPDYVIDEKTGLLGPERDVEFLAEAIERFCKMENDEFTLFSKRAIDHVFENYSIFTNAKNLSYLYSEILGRIQ